MLFDQHIEEGISGGAQVLIFQTNNADFRGTDENLQQLAFARMRAIESGRSVVNVSTVGTSQVIAPDGTTIDQIGVDERGAIIADVELRDGTTPASCWARESAGSSCGSLSCRRRSSECSLRAYSAASLQA